MKLLLGLSLVCAVVKISMPQCALETEYFCSSIPQDFPENLKSILFILKNIGVINSTVFTSANLKSVTSLTLANSGVTRIDAGALHAFEGLTKLALYGNLLTTVLPLWFSHPGHLDNLTMTGNKVKEVKPHMLSGFSNLTVLNLAKNEIHSVASGSLKNLPKVIHIDLSDNRITSMKRNVFDDRRYPSLKLAGNPWNCTCELQGFSVFLQELMNASKLEDAFSVTCNSPPDLKGVHVWNISTFNCSADIVPSSTGNTFSKVGLPIILVGLALLLFLWLLLVLWKKNQDTKQVQPDQEQTIAKRIGNKAKESTVYIISKGPSLNTSGTVEGMQKAGQKDSGIPVGLAKGRAKSASAILLRSDFPKSSLRHKYHSPMKQEVPQITHEIVTVHSALKGGNGQAMEKWYLNSLNNAQGKTSGGDCTDGSNLVKDICLSLAPSESLKYSRHPTNPVEELDVSDAEGFTTSDNTEPLVYFSVDRGPEEPRQSDDRAANGPTLESSNSRRACPLKRTLTWPQERGQRDQDPNNTIIHEDFFRAQRDLMSQARVMFKLDRTEDLEAEASQDYELVLRSLKAHGIAQPDPEHILKDQPLPSNKVAPSSEGEAESRRPVKRASMSSESELAEDYDVVLNSLMCYQIPQLDNFRRANGKGPPTKNVASSTKKLANSANPLARVYTSPTKKPEKGSRGTKSRQKAPYVSAPQSSGLDNALRSKQKAPNVSAPQTSARDMDFRIRQKAPNLSNTLDNDLTAQSSPDRAGHRGSPSDDNLLENNEYNFIDLLHEVVENHGRWTRERWKQTHQQRIASRPFLQTQ
ncbi:uncharacterized protein [Ambystoma mexicanum]|uniref:uncharacterized protein n=1 Tax=Ambystoma mexicanum TaxID=8296 RepID=UPI0037E70DB8